MRIEVRVKLESFNVEFLRKIEANKIAFVLNSIIGDQLKSTGGG